MKELLILGSGGFAREVVWLVERINKINMTWNILGYVDEDAELHGKIINSYRVLGADKCIANYPDAYVVCAIGSSKLRKKIVEKVKQQCPQIKFASLVDPKVEISDRVTLGEGVVICANSVVTVNIDIGSHVIINLDCTVGHDAILHDYVTVNPSVNISGNVEIEEGVELGTGTQIIQGKRIGANSVIGAGSVVVRDIVGNCTAVGIPAKPIKFFD